MAEMTADIYTLILMILFDCMQHYYIYLSLLFLRHIENSVAYGVQ